jgi:predicted CxxxxCH...CXXCH cytochrome family protein
MIRGAARASTGRPGAPVARAVGCVAWAALVASCSQDRFEPPEPPVFDADVAPIFARHCVACHGATAPAAGWSATSFLSSIACVEPSGAPATLPAGAAPSAPIAPLLSALDVDPHQGLLDAGERATVAAWVAAGAPAFAGEVHAPGIVDPRSSSFHGAALRAKHWAPMLDATDPEACGQCHDGTPAPVAGVTSFAPGATSCTSCHAQPGGVLACGTCHGTTARAYPPRDPCFFPGDAAAAGAHAVHVEPSQTHAAGFACATCHPVPGSPVIAGLHGDGLVEVTFDAALVGPEASFDPASGTCAVTCHDFGGARPRPAWTDTTPMACTDCHGSPPPGHFPGSCTSCHSEANATGTALSGGPLHLDGRVELGDGSGACGACHGSGDDPWPRTAAHPAHESPTISAPVACASCHPVPASIEDPVHLDGVVHVAFSGLALARGAAPSYDGATCASVACHGAVLPDVPAVVPAWADPSGAASQCGACHGIPPSQHTPSKSCDQANCHAGEVVIDALGVPSITAAGTALHINGVIDHN